MTPKFQDPQEFFQSAFAAQRQIMETSLELARQSASQIQTLGQAQWAFVNAAMESNVGAAKTIFETQMGLIKGQND